MSVQSTVADTSSDAATQPESTSTSHATISAGAWEVQQSPAPLTTVFTPPTDCGILINAARPANVTGGNYMPTTCYPALWEQYQSRSWRFYSPGVCPMSAEWASIDTIGVQGGQWVTRAWCCPQGLPQLVPYVDKAIPRVLCAGTTDNYAMPVSVAWKSSDLASFVPPSAPLTALRELGFTFSTTPVTPPKPISATTSIRTIAVQSPAASETSSSDGSESDTEYALGYGHRENVESGLSTGAVVGMGVGIGIAVLMIAIMLFRCIRHRRRRRRQRDPPPSTFPQDDTRDEAGEKVTDPPWVTRSMGLRLKARNPTSRAPKLRVRAGRQ